jgi:formylglycine-generating enzyme required for sulfatase activity
MAILDTILGNLRDTVRNHPGLSRSKGHLVLVGYGSSARTEYRNIRIKEFLETEETGKVPETDSRKSAAAPQRTPSRRSGKAPPLAVAPFDAAIAKQHQQAWAKHFGVPIEVTNSVGIKLILIPPGEFMMGSPDSDDVARSNEKPLHNVTITKPFWMGKYEVTQEQWEAVMGNNPSPSLYQGPRSPVDNVSWDDCQAFIDKLNEKFARSGEKFSLPTEAQWEYACRAGSTGRFSWGDSEESFGEYAWFGGNSGNWTHPVGEKKPNAWGLYDKIVRAHV